MPLHPAWAAIAKEEPDARAKRSRNEKKSVLLGWMEECFCINCGKPHGMAIKQATAYVFCLCDACVFTHGKPPGAIEVPESLIRGRRMERLSTLDLHNETAQPLAAFVYRRGNPVPLLTLGMAAYGHANWNYGVVQPLLFDRRDDLVVDAGGAAIQVDPGWDES